MPQRRLGAQGAIEGLKEIKLFNRRMSSSIKPSPRAAGLTKTPIVSSRLPILADQQAFAEALASADILTNGTKVGMKPLENESLVNDISLLHPGLLVTGMRV
ncbi:quinate/shikimate dehydrogenase [Escherichia coli]|uniref:Quinate/shikimate dehydrogenase n=1 Tax=Escherichia coli TaxID=562 RepID=A0A377A2P8_ECOLX|nr:quinate/shikimate dehydrogenase [Escherichia coli]